MHIFPGQASDRQSTAGAPDDLTSRAGRTDLALARLNGAAATTSVKHAAPTASPVFAQC